MRHIHVGLNRVDEWITAWTARYGVAVLRASVGIVFFWFGALKFFPGLSPAEKLAARTIATLSFGLVQPAVSLRVLAAWECLIGLGLIGGLFVRFALALMFLQMCGTVTPLFLFPHETWVQFPFAATLEGQYIIKNLVLVSAGLVLYAATREGAAFADPRMALARVWPRAVQGPRNRGRLSRLDAGSREPALQPVEAGTGREPSPRWETGRPASRLQARSRLRGRRVSSSARAAAGPGWATGSADKPTSVL